MAGYAVFRCGTCGGTVRADESSAIRWIGITMFLSPKQQRADGASALVLEELNSENRNNYSTT